MVLEVRRGMIRYDVGLRSLMPRLGWMLEDKWIMPHSVQTMYMKCVYVHNVCMHIIHRDVEEFMRSLKVLLYYAFCII